MLFFNTSSWKKIILQTDNAILETDNPIMETDNAIFAFLCKKNNEKKITGKLKNYSILAKTRAANRSPLCYSPHPHQSVPPRGRAGAGRLADPSAGSRRTPPEAREQTNPPTAAVATAARATGLVQRPPSRGQQGTAGRGRAAMTGVRRRGRRERVAPSSSRPERN